MAVLYTAGAIYTNGAPENIAEMNRLPDESRMLAQRDSEFMANALTHSLALRASILGKRPNQNASRRCQKKFQP
jgi:hypothetical protein